MVVRVSGLPAETVAPFTSPVLLERVAELERLEGRIDAARQRVVGRLYETISDTLPPLRGFLLALKRDCYNGRRLEGRRDHASWTEADRLTDGELSRLADLEEGLAAAEEHLAATCEEERQREHAHLLTLLDDKRFLRGVALASPLVASRLDKLAKKPLEAYGRKDHRLAASLLRYASRAALKLSPYSTLTTIGLARAVPDGDGDRLRLEPWRDRSLLRLRRYVLDRVIERLLRHPEVRARFRVTLNDSVSEQETGRYRFVRPGRWNTNPETGESRFLRDSLVEVRLGGVLPGWLLKELRERPRSYLDLVRDMARELGDGEADEPHYAQILDQLLDLGFSCLEPPWPATEPHLELRLLRELEVLPPDAELAPAREALRRLVNEQRRFDTSPSPAANIRGIRRLTAELWQHSSELSGLGSGPASPAEKAELYEDVFLQPSHPSAEGGEILRIPRERAERLLRSLDPLTRLAGLYQSRLEFLISLSAFGIDRWSAGAYVPVLDVFQAARSLWRDYARHRHETPSDLFDPSRLPELERLRSLRQAVHARMLEAVTDGEDGLSLSSSDLEDPLAAVPEEYRSPVGPCLFLQPLDTRGERWVLNRLYEGTGRFASRFTSVMPSTARRAFTSRMKRSSRLRLGGQPVTLLDLLCVQGDTLNVHALETPAVLQRPGDRVDDEDVEQLGYEDLLIHFPGGDSLPRVTNRRHERYLPVHLGGADHRFMPSLVRFLSLFGPDELRPHLPHPGLREDNGCLVRDRLTLGDVVLLRKRWIFRPGETGLELTDATDVEAVRAIQRWRARHGIPSRAFLIEKIRLAQDRHIFKPQYVDFSSPSFLPIVTAVVDSTADTMLDVEEMLPGPEAAAVGPDGGNWPIELLLDSLAFAPVLERQNEPPELTATAPSKISSGAQPHVGDP